MVMNPKTIEQSNKFRCKFFTRDLMYDYAELSKEEALFNTLREAIQHCFNYLNRHKGIRIEIWQGKHLVFESHFGFLVDIEIVGKHIYHHHHCKPKPETPSDSETPPDTPTEPNTPSNPDTDDDTVKDDTEDETKGEDDKEGGDTDEGKDKEEESDEEDEEDLGGTDKGDTDTERDTETRKGYYV